MKLVRLFLIFIAIVIVGLLFTRKYVRLQRYNLSIPGTIYAVNKRDSSITAFDLEKGQLIKHIPLYFQPKEIVALPSRRALAVANYGDYSIPGNTITLIDLNSHSVSKEISLRNASKPYGIINSNKMNSVFVAPNEGKKLIALDLNKDTIQKILHTKQKQNHLMVLHPFKPFLYVTHKNSGAVSVINYESFQLIKTLQCSSRTDGIDITPDGDEVWVTNPLDETITIIDTYNNEVIDHIPNGKESLRLRFTIDGKTCYSTNALDGTVHIFDRYTRKKIKTIVLPGISNLWQRFLYKTPRPVGILMHPNGQYAFITNSNADKIEVIDIHAMKLVGNISTERVPDAMAIIDF